MPRRTLITASLLLLILALLALLPALPAVREYALERATRILSDADVELTYDSSSGNLWRGVTLEDVALVGAGSDVTIDRVRVGYFLPSLLGGELPLDIAVVGADGDLDLNELLGEFVTAPSGPQSRSLSLRLRRLDLRDIEVDVAQLPFRLPDAGLRTLDVVQDGTNLLLSGDIVTPDGEATLSGRYESLSGAAYLTVENADATIARHWWDGITAGQVSGELQIRGSSIEGDFVISGAAVDDVGLRAENVSGTATMRYPVITADLNGTAFGGPLEATGVVNVEARRWEANGVAQPTLAAAANWLARSQFPDGLPVDISGDAAVNLSIAGWSRMTLEGSASGAGAVEGVPLEDLNATFRIPTDGIVRADADATLGGGPIEVTMGPGAGGERLTVTAQGVGLETIQAGLGDLDATLDLQLGPDGSGSLGANWLGELAGTTTRAMLDATLDPDGWQGFIRAEDDAGLVAEGAVVLDDGHLQGRLTSDELGRDLLSPGARVALAVDGNLGGGGGGGSGGDSDGGRAAGIGVTLSIEGANSAAGGGAAAGVSGSAGAGTSQAVTITALPPALAEGLADGLDLRGSVSGVLDLSGANGPVLRALTGSFGPLNVSGNVALSPLRAELGVSSSAIAFSSQAASADAPTSAIATTIEVAASILLVEADGVSWNGTIEHGGVAVGPVTLQPGVLDALFALPTGSSWRLAANSRSGDLVVTADPDGFVAELNGLPLRLGEDSLALSGSLDGDFAGDQSEADNSATTPIALDLIIAADDAGPGRTSRLPAPVSVAGAVDLSASRAELRGELLSTQPLPYEAQIGWGEASLNGFNASITLPSTDQNDPLRAAYQASGEGAAGRFSLQGTAALSTFTQAADGSVTADLTGAVTGQGLADLVGGLRISTRRPTPVVAELNGNGSTIDVQVEGVSAGAEASAPATPDAPATPAAANLFSASGTIDVSSFINLSSSDEALITADIGPLQGVAIGLRGATGSGTLVPLALGPLSVPTTPWELTASWGQGAAPAFTMSLADEPLRFTLTEDGLELDGGVSIPVRYSGEEFVLQASVRGGVIDLSDLGATPLAATLTHLGEPRAQGQDASAGVVAAGEILASEVMSVEGTLASVELNGSLPTALLVPQLPTSNRPEGRLIVAGTVAPLDGPRFQAAIELTAELPPDARAALPGEAGAEVEPVNLSGTISGSGADVTANLSGAGLTFDLRDRVLAVTAEDTDLLPLLGIAGNIDGSLSLDTEAQWAGDLSISASLDALGTAAGTVAGTAPDGESIVANVNLQGAGDTLRANVVVTGPLESRLAVTGTLRPAMNLAGELNVAGGILLGELNYETDSGLVVDLASQELLVDEYIEVPALTARITLAPGEPLRLLGSGEPLRADVVAELAGGSDTLSGRISLPFTMLSEPAQLAIELNGSLTQPQFVAAVRGEGLRVDAVGDLQNARADIEIEPSVAAVLAPAAGVATELVTEPVRAEATWLNGEGWSLTAAATAFGAGAAEVEQGASDQPPTNEVDLLLSLTGEGDSYRGELAAYLPANPAERLAVATVEGRGADLAAELDLGSVAWTRVGMLLGVDLAITGSGTAGFATNPVRADLQLDLSGQVEGMQVELSGTAPNDIDLSLSSADVDLTAEIAWNEERKAVLRGSISGRPVDGWLELADDLRSGRLSLDAPGASVEAILSTTDDPAGIAQEDVPGGAQGDAQDSAQGAQVRHLEITASLSGELLDGGISSQDSAPTQSATQGLSADLTALVTLSGARAELESFNANVRGLPTDQTVELTAAGPLTPTTDVSGSIYAPALDERAELYIAKPGQGEPLTAGLQWQDLDLGYSLAEGRFSLSGSADLSEQLALGDLADLSVRIAEADVRWSPVAGFDGGFVLSVDTPLLTDYGVTTPLTVTAGAGEPDSAGSAAPLVLTVATTATPPNLPGATADAAATITIAGPLTSPSDLTLSGQLTLEATIPAQDQQLSARAGVSGTILAPEVSGTLSADGPIAATGTLDYADGRGSLSAQGPHVNVGADLAGGGWSAQALLDGLPIERWLPQLVEPRLSLNASASSGATSGATAESVGGADGVMGGMGSVGATVDGLLLEARNTRLSGAATIAGGVRVALQAQVDLADLQLDGTSFTGLMRGPLVLTAPSLAELTDGNITAQLDASEVGLAAVDETLSGSITVGGKVSDPTLGALLVGNGGLTGALRVNATPARGLFELTSSLAGEGFSTNLQVGVTEDLVMATGQARYQDAVVLLSDAPSGIELSGAGRLDGWHASIAADLATVAASGPLSGVSPAIAGDLDLLIMGGTGNPESPGVEESAVDSNTPVTDWLAASITGLSVGGTSLGDLDLSSAEPGADVLITGDGITASITPADLAWNLEVADVSLPGQVSVAVAGAGVGAAGALSGSVTRAAEDSPLGVNLDFTVSNSVGEESATTFTVDGSALGGDLAANGSRGDGGTWTGDLRLSGAEFSGFGLSATGVLQGQGLIPQAVLATALVGEGERPVSIVGRVSAGGNGVSFDQTAALPQFDRPLRLQGRLSPDLDVVLSGSAARSSNAGGGDRAASAVGAARLYATGGGLRASGEVTLPLGPVDVIIDGNGPASSPRVEVRLAAARNVAVEADLSASDLAELVSKIGSDGLVFNGVDAATGVLSVSLSPTLQVQLEEFGAELGGFALALSGELSGSGAELGGTLRLPLDLPVGAKTAGSELPLRVTGADGRWFVESSGDLGSLEAEFDSSDSRVVVDLDLALPVADAGAGVGEGLEQGLRSGAVVGRITYDPLNGPAGTLALADVTLAPSGVGELTLNADTAIADGRLGGSATLDTAGGRVTVNGATRLAEFFPALQGPESAGGDVSNLELRVRTLQLAEFPAIANLAPHLSGALSGVVQLRNGFMLGQLLAPDLAIGGEPVPLELQLTGPPSDLDAAMQFAGSLFTADLGSGRIAGSSRLERFPLDLLGEAFVGPTDVQAYVTGVLRFDLPSTDPVAGYVRLATEEITLERAGVKTTGRVALSYEDRHLNVQQAEFGGEGSWSAQGVLGPELLDFTLEANDADFSPLLGLVPTLSRFAVGAAGSFTFSAQGDFGAPQVSLISDTLDVSLAGTRFRIEDTDVVLSGTELSASTRVRGLDPLEGAIEIDGGATVMLEPLALRSVDFGFTGDLEVPGLGLVDDVNGSIRQNADNLPTLFMTGMLGQPLTVQGTLVPLDLRATGGGLEVALPTLLIADSTLDVDLTLNSEEGGVVVGGAIEASEVVIDPAARAAANSTPVADVADEPGATDASETPTDATDQPVTQRPTGPTAIDEGVEPGSESISELPAIRPASEQLESVDDSPLVSSPTVAEAQAQGALNARAAVRFNDVHITAPQRVVMSMSIASLEASVDLTLAGTAAAPRLSGEARALRGSLRFAGREFTVDRAVASFSPNRGVLPELDVAARAEFEKSRVLTGATDVEFVAPSDGNTFTVDLAFAGPMELDEDDGGISFDIVPVLTSDALVEISGEGVGAGVRPLSEAELLSLITLGRIEFGSDLIGAGGLGGAVAQGALDTAVDLLVVGELQNALREALGLDVVEIRTTAFSSLLGGEGSQPFGVSVRLGGYLNPELFASYRIGTTDPNDPGYGFTNEVALRYGLGPLNLDILGRLDFPVAGSLNDPRPELGVGVSYDFGRALSIDTGLTLSSQRQVVSFGVALRW